MFWHRKQRNQPWKLQTRHQAPSKTYGDSLSHDFVPWWMLSWQYGAKKLGVGRRWLILFLLVVWELKTNPKNPENFLPAAKCYSYM
jgi:hypothetical protein